MSEPAVHAPSRIVALDWLRLVAMAIMVQGHTFTAITEPSARAALLFGYHDALHGLTAPMFSFASGFAFGLATLRALESGPMRGPVVRTRFERYATLVFLGYLMHLKAPSLRALVATPDAIAAGWLVVDTLQCIGVTLAVAQLVACFARSSRAYLLAIGALLAFVVLAAPSIDRLSLDHLPLPIAAYLNGRTGSRFPLFPWAGYVLVGILATRLFTDAERRLRAGAPLRVFTLAALAAGACYLGTSHAPDLLSPRSYWIASPWLFLGRTSGLLAVLGLVTLVAPRLEPRLPATLRASVRTLSTETLTVYVAHLGVLYGTPFTRSLKNRFERDASVPTSSLIAVAILVFSIAFAFAWRRLKEHKPVETTTARRGSIAFIVARFVLS